MAVAALLLLGSLAAAAQAQEYRIVHCLLGCPTGAAHDNPLLLRPIYALSYNTERKSADWVAYRVTAGTVGIASSLDREPRADSGDYETLRPEVAKQLGPDLLLGQHAPLVNFAGTPYWRDTNYMSNAAVRSRSLTQGAWNGLEWAIRNLANRQETALYVLTGPVFAERAQPQRLADGEGLRVPDAFFKIVATEGGEAAAFLLSQDSRVGIHHCAQQATVAEIEAVTGLRFFPEAERSLRETLAPRLGCPP